MFAGKHIRENNLTLFCLMIVSLLMIVGCQPVGDEPIEPTAPPEPTPLPEATAVPTEPPLNMANPAAVYCEEQGYTYEIRSNDDGSQYGVCILDDGTECDGWAFFNGTCPVPTPVATSTAEPAAADFSDWIRYTNTLLGFTLLYPPDMMVEETDGGMAVSFTGPLVDNEHWPMLWVSSPDADFYRPPQDVDIYNWLDEHNRVDGNIVNERQIGGLTAAHTIRTRSPQSYASDDYFVIRGQHLFHIVLLHAADRQDWQLYHHFLDNISFDMSGGHGPEGIPTPEVDTAVSGWQGTLVRNPNGSQIDDYFVRNDGQGYGIWGQTDAVQQQLDDYLWTGEPIQVWGQLITGIPDYDNRQIQVTRLEPISGATMEARNLALFATASASSELPADKLGTYHAWSAIDGLQTQPWSEGVSGPGISEHLLLEFPSPIEVHTIKINVGYDYSEPIFYANNRIKQATLVFSNGESVTLDFADQRGWQTIPLARATGPNIETSFIKLIIEEVYPGSTYDDTCLGELEVWGIVK